jgi:hypothetical protein
MTERQRRRSITLALLKGAHEKLEDPAHPIDLLDDAAAYEGRANPDGARKDFGRRVSREGWCEGRGNRGLVLFEEEGVLDLGVW